MSAVQVMAQSGAGGAADRTPFFGLKIPLEMKKMVQLSKTLDAAVFKRIVKCESDIWSRDSSAYPLLAVHNPVSDRSSTLKLLS